MKSLSYYARKLYIFQLQVELVQGWVLFQRKMLLLGGFVSVIPSLPKKRSAATALLSIITDN